MGRTKVRKCLALGLVLLLTGCGRRAESVPRDEPEAAPAQPPPRGQAPLQLDSTAVARMGLRTVELTGSAVAESEEWPAVVVADPGATATLRAGTSGRLTLPPGRAWPSVGQRLETGDTVAVVGDAAPLLITRGGTVVALLAQPGEQVLPGQGLLEMVDYRAPLVRVGGSRPDRIPPAALPLSMPAGNRRYDARLLGPAPEADPVTGGPAWLYRLGSEAEALRAGTIMMASVPDPGGRRGVVVPGAAVVQWDAMTWAYLERGPGRYLRVRVPSDHPVVGGFLVTAGLARGDRIVVEGAEQLLSEEFRARITVGEEVGE
jgi:biotin carboxyl carrier protein